MRKFLVVLDDSNECLNAVRYAAMRAASTGGAVQALGVIPADDIQHGFGVAEVMRAEARERIEAQFEVYAKWMRDRPRIEPELVVREGDPATELLAQIGADGDIGVLVLAAATGSGGPGPLITRMMREISALPCPLTIVPGSISRERLEQIT
ncbi:universal stress protein [Paracoccus contaminans]|uniref:Universal stress protein n=1 Tax=Paracoccus contaminans TaxID=1945662 RepID=A0A1W6CVQ1_9RHOB|nr:universal stress protein [Paracoccus contaminans]ARJ68937.1 universal stress protein [Paracoccus contaminans]